MKGACSQPPGSRKSEPLRTRKESEPGFVVKWRRPKAAIFFSDKCFAGLLDGAKQRTGFPIYVLGLKHHLLAQSKVRIHLVA